MTSDRNDLDRDRRIARLLPNAWSAFFERFGRLTPIQRLAIPAVHSGSDALLISQTASGKTECAAAPLVERFFETTDPWTILYISPTRALVNDLYERLWQPLNRLSLPLKRRTGDHRDRVSGARVLITTPESFDSILCRGRTRRGDGGHALSNVVAVVIDEVHLLYGSARGEQVRWLLERLRRLRREAKRKGWARSDTFSVVALSATVADPEGIIAAYLPGGQTFRIDGGRSIESVKVACDGTGVEEVLPAYIGTLPEPEKILVFSNARRRVDDLAARLRPNLEELGYETRAHHGSLDRLERESTEEAIRSTQKIVVFATSTLELGIDIGDIDLVVLDGPAPDIMAFLQRVGRGNRRTDKTRVLMCGGSLLDMIIHDAMIDAAREGWLGPNETGPQFAVARQQVASYIRQSPRRARGRPLLQSLLEACAPSVVSDTLIDEMIAMGELVEDEHGVRLGEEWLEGDAAGRIHSNIEDMPGISVIDEETGRGIVKGLRYQKGRGLKSGGLMLEARRWDERKLEVKRVKEVDRAAGEWAYVSRAWIKGASQPQAVRRYLHIEEDTWPVVAVGERRFVFHFGGARRKALIQLAASIGSVRRNEVDCNEWFLSLPGYGFEKPSWLVDVGAWNVELGVSTQLDSLEYTLGRPRSNKRLPIEARVEEIGQWLALEEELLRLKESEWEMSDDEVSLVLLEAAATIGRF